ncbi:MAG: serine esterase [Bdellovibrionota bacterium]
MSTPYRQRKIAQLNVIEKSSSKNGPWIILLHGYGADAADLASLAQVIPTPENINWIFPDAPLKVPIGPHITGRAWFPIDMAEIEKAMMQGKHRDMSNYTPSGLARARSLVLEMISELQVPFDDIILGGFSQGAMLSTDICLRSDILPKGLVLLSGTLLNKDIWQQFALKRAGLKFFQSHGTADPILGFKQANDLNKLLTDSGLIGSLHAFEGGHEIPPNIISKLTDYIQLVSNEIRPTM